MSIGCKTPEQGARYGWVITAVSFSTCLLELGTVKAFGVFLVPVREAFDGSTAAVGATFAATHTIVGSLVPLVSILTAKYGSRKLTILGGAVMSLSLLSAAFTTNFLAFSMCIVTWGLGTAFAYLSPLCALLSCFPTDPTLPVAIVMAGCSLGMVILPPLSEFLVKVYGWRGAILLLAAVSANVCPLGGLIREQTSGYTMLPTADRARSRAPEDRESSGKRRTRDRLADAARRVAGMLALDVLWNVPRHAAHAAATFTMGITYSAWMIYLVPHAMMNGFGGQRAAFLSSVGGLGSLTGRLLYGPVLRSDHVTPVGMFGLLGAINVGAFALDPVLSAWYPATAALAFANGLALGTSVGLFIPMARQVLDEEWHIQGWAALSGSFSVGELVGGALAGALFDISGSYTTSFLTLAGLAVVSVGMISVERLLQRCHPIKTN